MTTVGLSASDEQIEIINHPAKIKIGACGRRWGKTLLMALYMAKVAVENPGCRVWYVANDYSLALAQMRMMKRSKPFMKLVKHAYAQFPPRFDMKNGSEIAFRSLDRPDLLLGAGLKLICLDEAARGAKDSFYRVLLPMLSDTEGTVFLGSTYNGRNWFYDLAEEGKVAGDETAIKTWTYPTSTGPRFRGPRGKIRLERLRSRYPPATWAQEFECEPLAQADSVFRFIERIIGGQPQPVGESGHRYCMGLDLGRTIDPTAAVVYDAETNIVVHAEEFPLGMEHSVQADKAKQIADRYNNALVVCDTTGGASGGRSESFVEHYRKTMPGIREIIWTRDRKPGMINHMALAIEQKQFLVPETFRELITQIKLYRYKLSASATLPIYSAPQGEHDDQLAGLCMCLWAIKNNWLPGKGGQTLSRLLY